MFRSIIITLLLCASFSFAQTGEIAGMVTDEDGGPLTGANVFIEGTTMGASTDLNGEYVILNVPEGEFTLMVDYVGYQAEEATVSVLPGETTQQDFVLQSDMLNMSAVVVTGTATPKKKLESSVAITTVDPLKIERMAPRNTADLLKAIPGFYVESSGGEGGNNLFTRGIPADGSFRYVSVQEDGMPVFAAPECMFFNIDLAVRLDENLERMESVRGGSGSIFASNAAGGIINYISKTGGSEFDGNVKFSAGDYGMFRTDLEFGGPISESLRYHVGGFYRTDQGIRPTGFTANNGGQLKANLTYLMDRGHVRLYGKYLNDRNVFYLPIPLTGLDEELSGFDANYGTMTSQDLFYLNVRKPQGRGYQEQHLDRGMNPELTTFGGELNYALTDNITVREKFKRSVLDHQFNAIFSLNDPMTAEGYAADKGIMDPMWSYARGGNIGGNAAMQNLNGNGLVVEVGWWAVTMPMQDFINDLSFNIDIADHSLTVGHYFGHDKQEGHWWWHNVLTEVGEDPMALDLVDGNTGVSLTDNGFTRYGSNYLNYNFSNFINAVYVNDEFSFDAFTFDIGFRYEVGDINGMTENTSSYDMGDATTMADDNVLYGNGSYQTWDFEYDEFAYSAGLNYKLNDNLAAFGRISNGFRAPDDNNLVFDAAASARVEDISQYEVGGKYNSPNLAAFGTFFYSTLNDFPFSDEVVDPQTGTVSAATRFADATAMGLELEVIGKYNDFGVDFTGTFQDVTYRDYQFTQSGQDFDFDGNQVRRIPQIFFTLTPFYELGDLRVDLTVQHFGDRFTDDANTASAKLPAFTQFNAGAAYDFGDFTIGANAVNLTNVIGITEGNPRTESVQAGQKAFRMARPIMGRTVVGFISYNF